MRRPAFPVIVGVSVTLLVALMVLLLLGVHNYLDPVSGARLFGASQPPDLPAATQTEELVQSGSTASSTLTPAEVEAAWAPAQQAAAEGNWQAWAEVVDADTGEVLLATDPTAAHTPASTQKVLTAFYALSILDPDQTLDTGVSQVGSDLYLWGQGDLLLSASTGDPDSVNGHAGLGDLADETAEALAAQGISAVTLHYQDTLFAGSKRNPAWTDQGVVDYAGDVGPYAIDTGRVAPDAWQFVDDSSLGVAEAFSVALQAKGIAVSSVSVGDTPADATQIAAVSSAPVIDQIQFLLETSDNTMAEQYCHLAIATFGDADFSSSTASLKAFLIDAGLPAEGATIADCSGLDNRSRISAELLTQTLLASSSYEDARGSLLRLLPVAGMSGTLSTRLEDASTLGNVEAKTGSLGHVTTLAGVLTTNSGQNLIFAVGNDNVPDDAAYWTRDYLDEFIASLAGS